MSSNTVHPTALIGDGVVLGSGNVIGPYVVIASGVRLGDENWIGAQTILGATPEHRAHPHPPRWGLEGDQVNAGLILGDRNILRESVVVQSGRMDPTRIGDHAFVMAHAYVAHDVNVEDAVTLSASVALAGHAVVGAGANLGVGAAVRQHVRVGAGTMVGMGAVVVRDLPPLALAVGVPARTLGANRIGLERAGLAPEEIEEVDALLRAADETNASSGRLAVYEQRYRTLLVADH